MSPARKYLHEIIDHTPEKDLEELKKIVVDFKVRQFQKYLDSIPYDDEPVTEEELRDIEIGLKEIELGKTISLEEIKKELDL